MQKNTKNTFDKKALSVEIKSQITQSLSHLKELWGEKKFNNKIDDAVKLFTKGFKKQENSKESDKKEKITSVKAKEVKDEKVGKKEIKKQDKVIPEVAPQKQAPQKAIRKSPAKSAK